METLIKWYDPDLEKRMSLAARYIERILSSDTEYDGGPYFAFIRQGETKQIIGLPGTTSQPHAVGRGMDFILNYQKYFGCRIAPEAEAAYFRHFFNRLDDEFGLCVEDHADGKGYCLEPHNFRESVEALTLLLEVRGDNRAIEYMEKAFRCFELITDRATGCFSAVQAEAGGKLGRFAGNIYAPQPCTAGRLIGPLMKYYRTSGDARALKFAGIFTLGTLNCFSDDGEMLEQAGTHIHSITSSLSGVADYAFSTENTGYIAKLERMLAHPKGMPLVVSSFGWVKEQIRVEGEKQGEVNQVGDMLQLYIAFAENVDSARWYGLAETFMRGGILPAQVTANYFAVPLTEPKNDLETDGRRRMIGGFGFPMPASHLRFPFIAPNSVDITQGAGQAICVFREHIAMKSEQGLDINLLFSTDNAVAHITSELPVRGRVEIIPRVSGLLRVRIPSNIIKPTLCFTIDSDAAAYSEADGYACLPVRSGDVVMMSFKPDTVEYGEICAGDEYTVKKFGEQTVSVTPQDGEYPMFDEADLFE
jgi:hypothetical protein